MHLHLPALDLIYKYFTVFFVKALQIFGLGSILFMLVLRVLSGFCNFCGLLYLCAVLEDQRNEQEEQPRRKRRRHIEIKLARAHGKYHADRGGKARNNRGSHRNNDRGDAKTEALLRAFKRKGRARGNNDFEIALRQEGKHDLSRAGDQTNYKSDICI